MNIIFLDIDGVLVNSNQKYKRMLDHGDHQHRQLDPSCVAALNKITDRTRAVFVMSSSWRFGYDDAVAYLKSQGVTGGFLGRTAPIDQDTRGLEIQDWLRDHSYYGDKRFIIIDDDADMGELKSRLVQPDRKVGLTDADADAAIKLLKE